MSFIRFFSLVAFSTVFAPNAFRLAAVLFAVSVVTARFEAVVSILFLSVVAVVSLVTPNAARLSFVALTCVMA